MEEVTRQENMSVGVTFIPEERAFPIGTVEASVHFPHPGYWYLNRLVVREEHRGKGYGPKLLARLWELLTERRVSHPDWFQADHIIVEPGGYGSDPEELDAFYKKMGFKLSPLNGSTDLCLVKTLHPMI